MVKSLKTWNNQSDGWFSDASAYTDFYKLLAQKIVPHLKPEYRLCDINCGLGRLDFELAPHVSKIFALDMSEYAVESLNGEICRRGVKNISAHHGGAERLEGEFDIILSGLFDKADIQKLLVHCRGKLIGMTSAGGKNGLYPERHRREVKNAVPLVEEKLNALGIGFNLELCAFEFGQPLKTMQDAAQFVLSNAPRAEEKEIVDFLTENIESTGREDFPHYLPYKKEMGIFIIDKA